MKSYGQYCGFARAAELLSERWTLILLRDLMVGPKHFNELRQGNPGIPSNVLTNRLRDLESAAVLTRALAGRGVVYCLTDYGRDLGPILLAIGRWGARRLSEPRPGELVTDHTLAAALLTAHTQAAVPEFSVEVTAGDAAAHAHLAGSSLQVAPGPLPDADLHLSGPGLRHLLATGRADAVLAEGHLTVTGERRLLDAFGKAFRAPIDPEM